jgi:hypothetical protein
MHRRVVVAVVRMLPWWLWSLLMRMLLSVGYRRWFLLFFSSLVRVSFLLFLLLLLLLLP